MSALQLHEIAKRMEQLERFDIQVTMFEVMGLNCRVESTDTQQDGRVYYLKDVLPKGVL